MGPRHGFLWESTKAEKNPFDATHAGTPQRAYTLRTMAEALPAPMRMRMKREIAMLCNEPPPGVCAWPLEGRVDCLRARTSSVPTPSLPCLHTVTAPALAFAELQGPSGSPYEKGTFELEITIPRRSVPAWLWAGADGGACLTLPAALPPGTPSSLRKCGS